MKSTLQYCIFTCLILSGATLLQAQTPADALMMDKGQICFAALYTHDTWDEYWEGTLKRTNGNIGTLTRQTIMPMFALGITDRFNIIGALPWMKTEASGGQMRGVTGFQDFGLWLKATALEKSSGAGIFSIHTVIGMTLPSSDYLEDYAPFSLGLGCPDFSIRATPQYLFNKGFYVRGTAAYNIRGTAKIERDYYYTTQGIYSDEVDMPNAVSYGGTLGYWLFDYTLQVEATYDGLNSLGGHDIRRQDAGFPSNKMNFTRVGAFVHYYPAFAPGFGIVAQLNQVLTGRNVGMSTAFTGGFTYQFGLWNKEEMPVQTN
jgi:hypothetical protein